MTRHGPWTKVRERRQHYGLGINELANLAGIARSYMSMLENGERWPSVAVTVKLARALDVSPDAIARRKEPPRCQMVS